MHIRGLDEPTLRELVRLADAAGMSLPSYVVQLLRRHAAMPTAGDIVACASRLGARLLTLDARLARSETVQVILIE